MIGLGPELVQDDGDLLRRAASFRQPFRQQALFDVAVGAVRPVAKKAIAQFVAKQVHYPKSFSKHLYSA